MQHLAERITERRGFSREHVPSGLDERHLTAESAHGLRHLDADRAAAEHEQATRDGLHARDLAVRPDAVELAQTGDGRDDGIGAGGKDDVLRRVTRTVDLDDAGPGEPAVAAKQVDPVIGEPALLAGVGVVRDHEVAPGERAGRRRRERRTPRSLAACAASPGRSSVLDGMHAQ